MTVESSASATWASGFLLTAVLGLGLQVLAQERPFDTNVCALTLHPDKYHEGLVSVEGWITVGREEFMLHDDSCGDANGKIWLAFGGDVQGTATGGTPRPATGNPCTFDGLELPLKRDRDFDLMQKLLQAAEKAGKTKMLRATLTGKYFSGRPTKLASGETIRAGYGRMGCCSLLVIEEVAKVSSELEEPVDFTPVAPDPPRMPARGCTVSEVAVAPREDEDQLERKSLEEEFRYLHDPKKVASRAIAVEQDVDADTVEQHLQAESGSPALATYAWQSADGLSSYHIMVNKPYWLLATAQSGDAVIWAPKKMTKTVCTKPEIKPNIPIKH